MPAFKPRNPDLPILGIGYQVTVPYVGTVALPAGRAINFTNTAPTGPTDLIRGILIQDVPASSITAPTLCTLQCAGDAQVLTDAVILPGQPIAFDSFGKAVVAAGGQQISGRAVSQSSAAGVDRKILISLGREGTA